MCSFYEELGDIFGNSPAIIPVATGYNHRPEHNILHNLRFAATPTTPITGKHHIEEKDGVNHAEATPIKISLESYSQRRDLINNRLRLLARESLRRETIYIYEFPSWITNKDLFCRDEIHFTHFGMSKYYFAIKAAVLETRGIGTNKRLEKHNTSHSDDDLTTTPLASPTTDTVAETSSSVPSTSRADVTVNPDTESTIQQADVTVNPDTESTIQQADVTVNPDTESTIQQADVTVNPDTESTIQQADVIVNPDTESTIQQADVTVNPDTEFRD
ncbi:unnamed protein product [Mytilus edulis]|uniref:Uncharacterized protein n=1 Tax=Mytilus edulis TaxID=6550 RepID=A0A8S3TJP0_MYTED|nr:unnamed protein product [Mytilus edulis]